MEADQAKWFLKAFSDGKKLSKPIITELYLWGYIEIELPLTGKGPQPTVITEKGKQALSYKPKSLTLSSVL